jgi:tol-pal system protein YbgF
MLTAIAVHVMLVGVLALAVGIMCRLGRFRPAICHALWLVVLAKLLIPPVMAWPVAIEGMLPSLPWVFTADQGQILVRGASETPEPAMDAAGSAGDPGQMTAFLPSWLHLPFVLALLWCAGGLFVLALHVFWIHRFRAMARKATPAPDWLQCCCDELAEAFGVRRPSVKVAEGVVSALVWNPRRPVILVSPKLLGEVEREEWRGILAHELAHLKRGDLWVGWLELAAACVWWWNPLLGVVRRRLHLHAELACDAWVLWALPESGRQYAGVLFRLVTSESGVKAPVPAFGMAAGPAAAFKMRLRMLLDGNAACRVSRKAGAAVVLLLLLVLPSVSLSAKAAPPAPADNEKAGKTETGKITEANPTLSFSAPMVTASPATGTTRVTSADGKRGFEIREIKDNGQPVDDAAAAYKEAQSAYIHSNWEEALDKFTRYLEQYPDAENAANAQFWKAKCLFSLNRHEEAITEFEAVRTAYPASNKVPYAMHQEAICHHRLGQTERAVELLQEVARDYPSTPVAEQAKRDLERLKH